jgi:hypothetical protein
LFELLKKNNVVALGLVDAVEKPEKTMWTLLLAIKDLCGGRGALSTISCRRRLPHASGPLSTGILLKRLTLVSSG